MQVTETLSQGLKREYSPASWVWLEGLVFPPEGGRCPAVRPVPQERSHDVPSRGRPTALCTSSSRCRFSGFHYTMDLKTCSEFYIADNIIEGDNDPISGGLGGEGVELNKTNGHIVAHNRISHTADCISYRSDAQNLRQRPDGFL